MALEYSLCGYTTYASLLGLFHDNVQALYYVEYKGTFNVEHTGALFALKYFALNYEKKFNVKMMPNLAQDQLL